MFKLELKNGSFFVIEYGEKGLAETFYFNLGRFTDYGEIQKALKEYNDKLGKRSFLFGLLYSMGEMVEVGEAIENIELSSIGKEIFSYVDNNPNDRDFLFYFIYELLHLLVYNDSDLFDINSVIRKIVDNKQVDEFLKYIEDYNTDSDGNISAPGYYVPIVSCTLNKIHEIESENEKTTNG